MWDLQRKQKRGGRGTIGISKSGVRRVLDGEGDRVEGDNTLIRRRRADGQVIMLCSDRIW
jgi:hypothetical protein